MLACYTVLRHGNKNELACLYYEIMKLGSGSEYIAKENIQLFVERIVNMPGEQVNIFYQKTKFDNRLPIKKGIIHLV